MKKQKWYDFLWIAELIYFVLGFFNILFAWLGMIFFLTPLFLAIWGGNKTYCHKYCGRGQLFARLGRKLSTNRALPNFMRSNYFRYGFLAFFMIMFINMIITTYLVFIGNAYLSADINLFWAFNIPWAFAIPNIGAAWIANFAFGFYGMMLTSCLLGIITMLLFKPRGFCVYCPMGTMTQAICRLKYKGE